MQALAPWLFNFALCSALLVAGFGCSDDPNRTVGGGASGGSGGVAGAGAGPGGGTGGGPGGSIPGSEPGAPVIFYTDLVSAPPGAYVTLWGRRFGASQGGSTVTLGAVEITDFVSWSDAMIELRLPASAASAELRVHTPEGDSPPMPLGVHQGSLYFVAADGDDGWSGTLESAQGADGPFQTLTRGRDALQPGDVLYLRSATFTAVDNYDAILALRDVPTGTAELPVAIVAYPGETVTFGDNTVQRSISLYRGDGGPPFDYLTIAKLTLRPSCNALRIGNANHTRIVGNEIFGVTDACMSGAISSQATVGLRIIGNTIHDGGNTKFEHGIYLGGYGRIANFEIAWNRIYEQAGGRGIQLFGHQPSDVIELGSIHDNAVWEIDRDGIVLGNTDADVLYLRDIVLYNNVFHRAGRCTGWGIRVNNTTAERIEIFHNTLVDNGSGERACHESSGSLGEQLTVQVATSVEIRNNLLVARAGEGYVDAADPSVIAASHNLYFGADTPPAWDEAPVAGDPLFVDEATRDFRLQEGSAAIDQGTAVAVTSDHAGIARPQGAAPDVGAYEWTAPP